MCVSVRRTQFVCNLEYVYVYMHTLVYVCRIQQSTNPILEEVVHYLLTFDIGLDFVTRVVPQHLATVLGQVETLVQVRWYLVQV